MKFDFLKVFYLKSIYIKDNYSKLSQPFKKALTV